MPEQQETPADQARCAWWPAVDRHFAGPTRPGEEHELRLHLPDCPMCQRRYERHLLLARLVRDRLDRADRLAMGLGLTPRGPPPAQRSGLLAMRWPLAVGALGAIAAGFLIGISQLTSENSRERASASAAAAPAVLVPPAPPPERDAAADADVAADLVAEIPTP